MYRNATISSPPDIAIESSPDVTGIRRYKMSVRLLVAKVAKTFVSSYRPPKPLAILYYAKTFPTRQAGSRAHGGVDRLKAYPTV